MDYLWFVSKQKRTLLHSFSKKYKRNIDSSFINILRLQKILKNKNKESKKDYRDKNRETHKKKKDIIIIEIKILKRIKFINQSIKQNYLIRANITKKRKRRQSKI